MNWSALGQATGWLPGATGGAILGGLLGWILWEGFIGPCPPGVFSLDGNCALVLGMTFASFGPYLVAAAAIGGVVGAVVNGLVAWRAGEPGQR
ncbi:MAG: hypothetical protein ABIS84_00040 [Arachnia sp.]